MTDLLIIGGGISGLSAASHLKQAGLRVRIYEAAEQVGGNLRTTREDGYVYEQGPHSFMPSSDDIWALIERLGLNDKVLAAKDANKARFIWRGGKLHKLPMSPGSFLGTELISFFGKLRLMMEPLIPGDAKESDTAEDFFRRRLGEQATRWMIAPFVGGIYAGDPAQLGARDAFNKMWTWERERGSMILGARAYLKGKRAERGERAHLKGLFSFHGGLGDLTGALGRELADDCVISAEITAIQKTSTGWRVESRQAHDEAAALILATPPGPAQRLLAQVDDQAAALAGQIEMAPVAVLHLGIDGEDAQAVPDGFGFLAPRNEGLRTLGCVFVSRLFDERAPEGAQLLSCYLGGVSDPQALKDSDERLLESVVDDLEKVLGRRVTPRFVRVLRHPTAIPQLTLGHLDRIQQLQTRADELGGLVLAGNYLSGVGMNDAAASGLVAAQRVQTFFDSQRRST
jgi:oxygen-dependent protoporphyrinogen oxidase